VFLYLNPNTNGNPYDLQVCNYQNRNEDKYYTLSSKGMTLYVNETPVEFITLGDWLIERDSYNHIKELSFFKKFKKWKLMRKWRKNILSHKRAKVKRQLEEKLFMLDDIFRPHLLKHRAYCNEMSNLRFVDLGKSLECMTITGFAELQQKKKTNVSERIQAISETCRSNVKQAIEAMLNELRERIISELALDEEQRKNNPSSALNQAAGTASMKRKKSNSVFENLGFPDDMTYGHRANLRKECSRFLRFAYLVDFLALESLTVVYVESVRELIERLDRLDKVNNTRANDNDMFKSKGVEPLFLVKIQFDPEVEIPESDIVLVEPHDFRLPPHGDSKEEDFDPTVHFETEKPKGDDDESEEDEPTPVDSDGDESLDSEGNPKRKKIKKFKKMAPTLFMRWLDINPGKNEILQLLANIITEGLEALQVFERWSKHDELTPYANALEEWDDMVGDDWEAPDKNTLNPYEWIKEDKVYQTQTESLQEIMDSAYEKAQSFL